MISATRGNCVVGAATTENAMTTYYVATLARYMLVEAENEWEARERGYRDVVDSRSTL